MSKTVETCFACGQKHAALVKSQDGSSVCRKCGDVWAPMGRPHEQQLGMQRSFDALLPLPRKYR